VAQAVIEIAGEKGKIVVYEDQEIGHVFAVIPYRGRVSPAILKEIKERTLDPWRYVDELGFLLDLTAWRQEAGLTLEDIKNKLEGKYKEIIDDIYQYLESASAKAGEEKKAKRKKRKRKKAKRGKKRRRQS